MSLTKVLEQIKVLTPVAMEDLETGAIETLNARRGRKRNAEEQLKSLRQEYFQDLLRSTVFILTIGSEREAFEKAAAGSYDNFGCFSSNPESFYRDLASRIPASVYSGKESVSSMFDILGRHLEDKAMELGVLGYPMLRFKQEYRQTIKCQEDFVQLIKTAINEQVGGEMAGLHAVRSITDSAIKLAHTKTNTPIIMSTNDEKLVRDLSDALERITPRVFVVVAGEASDTVSSIEGALLVKEVTAKTVAQTLKTIKNQLKK